MLNAARDLIGQCTSHPDKVVLECEFQPAAGKEILENLTARRHQLAESGLKRGDRVIVPTRRGNQCWIDTAAIWAAGLVAVPVDPKTPPSQLETILRKTDAKAMCAHLTQNHFSEGIPILPEVEPQACVGDEAMESMGSDELASIVFTSGSTGDPKGVALTHRSLVANVNGVVQVLSISREDRLFMAVPFRFISAISHFMAIVKEGATLIGTEAMYLQADYLRALQECNSTSSGGNPVQIRWIAEASKTHDLKLRWLMSSGDRLPPDVIHALSRHSPRTRLYVVYGLTELGGRFCIMPPEKLPGLIGSVGRPIPGLEVAILDDTGAPAPAGQVGRVHASGEALMEGYFRDEETTAQAVTSNGFHTGDLGYVDENGWVYLVGRSDDVFKSAGAKVSTLPIIDALMESGMVSEATVIPEEHRELGHIPHAYIVPSPDTPYQRGALLRFLRQRLAENHLPRKITLLENLPRTGSGKIDRKKLTAEIETRSDGCGIAPTKPSR